MTTPDQIMDERQRLVAIVAFIRNEAADAEKHHFSAISLALDMVADRIERGDHLAYLTPRPQEQPRKATWKMAEALAAFLLAKGWGIGHHGLTDLQGGIDAALAASGELLPELLTVVEHYEEKAAVAEHIAERIRSSINPPGEKE